MKKKLLVSILILIALVALPTAVFAHSQALSSTQFYACEAPTTIDGTSTLAGQIDGASITQDDALKCPVVGGAQDYTQVVQWSVTGPQGPAGTNGTNGADGATGPQGIQGPIGLSGLPFNHAACSEILTGPAQQENRLFCISGIEPDGGTVYLATINAAKVRIIAGTPISATPSDDWSGGAITYVSFTSGLHAEYHSDNVVRFYNSANQRLF